ncbi:hypothetical protein MHF_1589 [Mycoplasma haemofelis Ohio2]|uniref:Uncharacterized protein n=1 Tax=Mycoplasma haemofelis (strain Ohio2) TaxID=859194 RepID=F6FHQ5_MYCHI|nr:hypothetical protein MHF_1589 [Mycoplasma haemofelis Ohio2]
MSNIPPDSIASEKRELDIPKIDDNPFLEHNGEDARIFASDWSDETLISEFKLVKQPVKKKKKPKKLVIPNFDDEVYLNVTDRRDIEDQLLLRAAEMISAPTLPPPVEEVAPAKEPEVKEVKPPKPKEPPKERAPIPLPDLEEVQKYLSSYPIDKIYRGIFSEASCDFVAEDAYSNKDVVDEIIAKSREEARIRARFSFRTVGKDALDDALFDYAKAPLASEEEIFLLEEKHMKLYAIVARIQENHAEDDFKSAYQIQDRISYLLNHQTLLYKSLTKELIRYLDSIIEKLNDYHEKTSVKYAQLKKHNERISTIKQYKWKSDDSMKIIQENQRLAQQELNKFSDL